MNTKAQGLRGLQQVVRALRSLDTDLRKITCPTCGKPVSGIVPVGKTPEEVGLCIGHKEKANEPV